MSKSLSDFQRSFLARGTDNQLFTQKEFDETLALAKAEIMQVAIETTKQAIGIEREECAKIADSYAERSDPGSSTAMEIADDIRGRMTGRKPKETLNA